MAALVDVGGLRRCI